MAYLHCHTCGWEQDDFWSQDGYTPFNQDHIDYLKKCLFENKVSLDKEFFLEHPELTMFFDAEGPYMTGIAYVAYELNRMAHRVEKMAIRTKDEWKKVKGIFRCPQCKSRRVDVD